MSTPTRNTPFGSTRAAPLAVVRCVAGVPAPEHPATSAVTATTAHALRTAPPPLLRDWTVVYLIGTQPSRPASLSYPPGTLGAMSTDLIRLARRQHGLVSVTQLRAMGVTHRQIRNRIEREHWAPIRRGVYVVGGAPPTKPQAICAVVLAAGPTAVASH